MFNKKLEALAAKLGLTFEIAKEFKQGEVCYNGDKHIKSNNDSNLAHEIAHYLVADESRRSKVNYGLGSCPDEFASMARKDDGMLLPRSEAQAEEELASMLGIKIEESIGMNWQLTLERHCWFNGSYIKSIEKKLFDLGFLTKGGKLRAKWRIK